MRPQYRKGAGQFAAALALAMVGTGGAAGQQSYYAHPGGSRFVNLELLQIVLAQKHMSAAERRASMVALIRRNARRADPALDNAFFEAALSVIGRIPREKFVPGKVRQFAFIPTPLEIGYDQTISDAYIVAVMTAQLHLPPNAEVLDVGTGSGYQAAVLSPLARQVSSIEIVESLAREAAKRLRHLGYRNIDVRAGDGFAGWPEHAPFDGIVVAAGAAAIPRPLIDQLKPGGRLVMPISPTGPQEQLMVVTKAADGSLTRCTLGLAQFVPLTGEGRRPLNPNTNSGRTVPGCYAVDVT